MLLELGPRKFLVGMIAIKNHHLSSTFLFIVYHLIPYNLIANANYNVNKNIAFSYLLASLNFHYFSLKRVNNFRW